MGVRKGQADSPRCVDTGRYHRWEGFLGDRMNILRSLCALAVLALTFQASAQYPAKPVKIIVPFAVGGTGDIVARLIAIKIGEQTGKVFVVENRTGAGGRIGYEA